MPKLCSAIALLFVSLATLPLCGEDWPQFRGPDGQGHSSERGLPLEWSDTQNIAWKAPIVGLGWSSPVVAGGKVWLTTAEEVRGSLRAIAVSCQTGKIVHNVEVFRKQDLGRISFKNSHASPTPLIDGNRVFVHYGAHGTACLTTDGKIVWKTELAYDHRHGPASSPVVSGDVLIITCDGPDQRYIVGLDKTTGKQRWKQDRDGEMAYSTPLVIQAPAGEQVVAVGGGATVAYNPQTGAEQWRCRFSGHSVVPRPVYANKLLYFCTGYWTPSLYVLRTDGKGDITDSHVVGRLHRSVPFTTSPLIAGGELYMLSDMGVLTCIDTANGKEHWHKRLGGNFSASPVAADGRIYVVSEDATTSVLKAGPQFDLLATNKLEGRALASPAVSDGALYIRTDEALYKIQDRPASVARRPQPADKSDQTSADEAAPTKVE